jgi:hypothetical protein
VHECVVYVYTHIYIFFPSPTFTNYFFAVPDFLFCLHKQYVVREIRGDFFITNQFSSLWAPLSALSDHPSRARNDVSSEEEEDDDDDENLVTGRLRSGGVRSSKSPRCPNCQSHSKMKPRHPVLPYRSSNTFGGGKKTPTPTVE